MSHARSKIGTETGGFVGEKATAMRSREDAHERDRAVARQRVASFLEVRGMS